jgi:hypothetical protein
MLPLSAGFAKHASKLLSAVASTNAQHFPISARRTAVGDTNFRKF